MRLGNTHKTAGQIKAVEMEIVKQIHRPCTCSGFMAHSSWWVQTGVSFDESIISCTAHSVGDGSIRAAVIIPESLRAMGNVAK